MNDKTKNGKFLEAINRFAEQQQKKLQDEVKAYKEERVEQATEEGLRDAYTLIQREISEKKSAIVTQTAKFEQDLRNELFSLRKSMTESVFENAKAKLIAFTETAEYPDKLVQSAEKIKEYFGDVPLTIYLTEKDSDKSESIAKHFTNITILTDKQIQIGGMRAYNAQSGVIIDETYDSKLLDERQRFIESCPMKVV